METKLNSYVVSVFTIFLLFFCLLPLCFFLGVVMDRNQEQTKIAQFEFSNDDVEVDVIREDCMLSESEDMGSEYIGRLVFLGESTTYGLWRYGLLRADQVWTGATCSSGSVRSAGTLSLSPTIAATPIYYPSEKSALTISQAVEKQKPEYLIITLGLNNGASYYTEDQFKQCYRILLNSVIDASDDVRIILQSLFPVAGTCKISAYTPERIRLCNSWIFDLAAEYNVKYLDTFSVLSDKDGFLLAEYDNGGDGIHLNAVGLTTVLEYIRTHGYPEEETA